MKRFGRPEEVVRAITFLAFEATYATGADLVVDGDGDGDGDGDTSQL